MFALIHNEKIIEITENSYPVHESLTWIDAPEGAEIGDGYVDGQLVKPHQPTVTWEDIRAKRDYLLAQSDWHITYATEKGEAIPQNVLDYRQALRDIPQNFATPEEVVFPSL